MSDSATSLDRLHDIVQPPPVPWWPPAPGWYVVLALAAVATAWLGFRYWRQWRANAYRREALRELKTADTPAEIAELLRRTAIAVAPRQTVASLSGSDWVEWLTESTGQPVPRPVHVQLAGGIYEADNEDTDVTPMRMYAETWIKQHHLP